MSSLNKFFESVQNLQIFLDKWSVPFDKRCEDSSDNQIRAAYYLWVMYSLSILAIRILCNTEFLPVLFVISRSCLEFDASLKAVLEDKKIAESYIEYEKHALCSYYKYLQDTKNIPRAKEVKNKMDQMGVCNPGQFKNKKWYPKGYSSLVEKYLGAEGKILYSLSSDFVHGSIATFRFLKNNPPPQDSWIYRIIAVTYNGYIISTRSFLDKAWESNTTHDGKACMDDFVQVAKVLVNNENL